MLTEFVGYWKYQKIIIFYQTGDTAYSDHLPMNVRFLGLLIQFLIFKIFPCVTFPNIEIVTSNLIKSGVHELYECATFSLALMNYLAKYIGLVLLIILISIKLNKPLVECVVATILYFLLINFVEASTMDRVAICYIFLILIFIDNLKIGCPLLLCAFLVNEKIIVIFGPILFFRLLFKFNKDNIYLFISICLSVVCYGLMILILSNFFDYSFFGYHNNGMTSVLAHFRKLLADPLNVSYITNAYLPFLISLFPFIIFTINRKNFDHDFSIFYVIPIFILILLGYIGIENMGRYVMHMFPFWLPIFTSQLVYYLKKI
tara:strand:+ start:3766 stop:4716 length:951 start_codon:yes stop_codon:yes gene_type:complete